MTTTAGVLSRPKERAPYQPFGGARTAWMSAVPELILCGPADTGKSRGLIEKLHYCADKYARARILMVRKSRTSLGQTAMVTYEHKVLPQGWLGTLIHFNTVEQQYEYPNGSIIAVGGMDKPEKVLSSEWDMIYPQEATELTENDWEILGMRLRNGAMPYQQLLGDCNPGPPTHWIKRRADRHAMKYIHSRHEDNPSITPERLARLKALTGVRYLRYYLGQWASSEGLVYDDWDRSQHIVSKQQLIAWDLLYEDGRINRTKVKRVLGGVDWGFTNPGVLHVYLVDNDDRLYLFREVYRTKRTIDWWIIEARKLQDVWGVERWICDPAEPAYIQQFNHAGLPAIGAVNDIAPGIGFLQARLKPAGDGRPRFYVYDYALEDRDESLEQAHQPYCLEQEIDSYVWAQSKDGKPQKEQPVDDSNHACLVAGTLVTTDHGDIPIEQIRAGDFVLTRQGYKPVKAAGMTLERAQVFTLHCSNGKNLTGTANHPIYLKDYKAYIPLRVARYGDIMETVQNYNEGIVPCQINHQKQKLLSSRIFDFGGILNRKIGLTETITRLIITTDCRGLVDCIKKSGKRVMALFQKDVISTIKTETRLTTLWKTLNVYQKKRTSPITPHTSLLSKRSRDENVLKTFAPKLLPGTNQMLHGNGMERWVNERGSVRNITPIRVNNAGMVSSHALYNPITHASVQIPVNPLSADYQELMTFNGYAFNAAKSLPAINIRDNASVQESALPVTVSALESHSETQPVYNLTVDAPVGEYFANGFLVHNCDVARYLANHLSKRGFRTVDTSISMDFYNYTG